MLFGFGGLFIPRQKEEIKVRGLWEGIPKSGIWWIRYHADGVLKREKVGTKWAAGDLLIKRKNQIRKGIKMPENMRHVSVRFKTLCDDILVLSEKHHRDFRSVQSLRDAIRERFPEHEAELTISLGTGMRLSEQYTLTWKNIDFERREIKLDRTKRAPPFA